MQRPWHQPSDESAVPRGAAWHTLHTGSLSLWLGAAALAGFVVAPSAFEALPTRSAAGAYVGTVLRPVFLAGLIAGLVAFFAVWKQQTRWRVLRLSLAGWVAVTGAASLGIAARIAVLREALGPIDLLDPADPRRKTFGMLHGISVLIFLAGMLAALVAIVLEPAAGGPAQTSRSSPSG